MSLDCSLFYVFVLLFSRCNTNVVCCHFHMRRKTVVGMQYCTIFVLRLRLERKMQWNKYFNFWYIAKVWLKAGISSVTKGFLYFLVLFCFVLFCFFFLALFVWLFLFVSIFCGDRVNFLSFFYRTLSATLFFFFIKTSNFGNEAKSVLIFNAICGWKRS